jgi:FkbM family methyltransferase
MTPPTTSPSGTAAPTSWETLVHPGDLVFDVGAGDGTTTDRLVARGARVICVEAHPTRASALRERYGVARYGGRLGPAGGSAAGAPVVVVDMGLANRTGRIPTSVPGVTIQLTTLDEMIRAFGTPRYCRIDVGGDPESILDGLTVATEPVIPLLSFEFKAARIENMRRALERLTRLGYRRFNWCRAPRAELVEPAWRGARDLLDDIVRESAGQGGASLRGDLFARGSDRELSRRDLAPGAAAGGRFAVTILRQPGNIHSECFRDLAETVNAGLNALGHDSVIAEELSVPGRRSIVFGSNLIANLDAPVAFPGGSILYNLEQIYDGSPWLTPDLIAAFRAHTVWDYSRANIGALAAYGVTAQHVPVGYVPALSRISPSPAPDIDVLFIGSLAERRLGILRALERQGARVVAIYGSYGPERDSVIARAKIVLNIHFHPAKVFEIVRVSYLLANRCFVVSETGSDAGIENAFAGGVGFADYDRLVDTCLAYLRDPIGRSQVASRGFAIMSSLAEADFLRPVVGEVGVRSPLPSAGE